MSLERKSINKPAWSQYVYKNEQETRHNSFYNTPTIEQVERLKKIHERLKKDGVIE